MLDRWEVEVYCLQSAYYPSGSPIRLLTFKHAVVVLPRLWYVFQVVYNRTFESQCYGLLLVYSCRLIVAFGKVTDKQGWCWHWAQQRGIKSKRLRINSCCAATRFSVFPILIEKQCFTAEQICCWSWLVSRVWGHSVCLWLCWAACWPT